MSFFSRLKAIFQAKANKALDAAEKPDEMLDLSFQKQTELLTKVRRGVADVATSKKRLELQAEKLQASVGKLESQAGEALRAGREDLARTALERKAGVQGQLDSINAQKEQLQVEQDKLVAAEQKLTTKIESFRVRKETIKAQYTAAEAQVKIGEAFSGVSEDMADVGHGDGPRRGQGRDDAGPRGRHRRAARVGRARRPQRRRRRRRPRAEPDRLPERGRGRPRAPQGRARLGLLVGGSDLLGRPGMIVRVLGAGQYRLDDADMAVVEKADDAVEAAIAAKDDAAFTAALAGLVATIQKVGDAVGDDEFVASDVIVPDADTTLADAAAYHDDDGAGLIPG